MRLLPIAIATTLTLGLQPTLSNAQSNRTQDSFGSRSWLPYTSSGYNGVNLGRTNFSSNCAPGFGCDDNGTGFKLYTGGKLSDVLGLEFGYVNLGKFDRSGGTVRAQGLNLSLIGNVPIANVFSVFGKIGTTYGFTRTSGSAAGVNSGNENGFGMSYGIGAGLDLSTTLQVVAEWDKHRIKTVNGRDDARLYSVGLRFKF